MAPTVPALPPQRPPELDGLILDSPHILRLVFWKVPPFNTARFSRLFLPLINGSHERLPDAPVASLEVRQ